MKCNTVLFRHHPLSDLCHFVNIPDLVLQVCCFSTVSFLSWAAFRQVFTVSRRKKKLDTGKITYAMCRKKIVSTSAFSTWRHPARRCVCKCWFLACCSDVNPIFLLLSQLVSAKHEMCFYTFPDYAVLCQLISFLSMCCPSQCSFICFNASDRVSTVHLNTSLTVHLAYPE